MRGFTVRKKSLTKRLLVYMLLIGLLPLLLFGIISIVSTNSVIKNETLNFHEQFVDQRKQYIDLVMSDIESLVANLSGIDEIKEGLTKSPADSSYDRLSTQAKIGYILNGYTNLKGLISIDLFSDLGIHFHVGETLNASNINLELKEQLFKETIDSNEFVYWSGIESSINKNSKYPYVIMASKVLKTEHTVSQGQRFSGLLVISYDPAVFTDGFIKYQNEEGYSMIVDAKKRILYHPDTQYIGKTISDNVGVNLTNQKGFFEQSINGEKTLVAYSKTQRGGWIISSQILLERIYNKSRIINVYFAGLLLIAIITIAVFGLKVSKYVVLPIRKVTDTFRSLQKGDLENPVRFDLRSGDEIGELGNLFNSFIDAREDITIQKKLERKLSEQNSELQETLEKLKTTQTQMLQQEKLAGIGQLAAGVAHEVNNPLGFVAGNVDMLNKYIARYEKIMNEVQKFKDMGISDLVIASTALNQLWKESKIDRIRRDMTEILADTQEGINRIANIVNGLKGFSRTNLNDEKYMFNLNEGIKTTLLIVNNELKYHCDVQYKAGELPDIYANGGQINQVLLNIIINAVYAIKEKHEEGKGIITIKTFSDGIFAVCNIEDNGCGMTEATKLRIFEPFFTTKPVGQGTGLGLGIAYDIISTKHAGKIDVESEVGIGSKFIISLPLVTNRASEEEPA